MLSHNLTKTVPSMKMKKEGCQRKSQVFAACKMYVALERILILSECILLPQSLGFISIWII